MDSKSPKSMKRKAARDTSQPSVSPVKRAKVGKHDSTSRVSILQESMLRGKKLVNATYAEGHLKAILESPDIDANEVRLAFGPTSSEQDPGAFFSLVLLKGQWAKSLVQQGVLQANKRLILAFKEGHLTPYDPLDPEKSRTLVFEKGCEFWIRDTEERKGDDRLPGEDEPAWRHTKTFKQAIAEKRSRQEPTGDVNPAVSHSDLAKDGSSTVVAPGATSSEAVVAQSATPSAAKSTRNNATQLESIDKFAFLYKEKPFPLATTRHQYHTCSGLREIKEDRTMVNVVAVVMKDAEFTEKRIGQDHCLKVQLQDPSLEGWQGRTWLQAWFYNNIKDALPFAKRGDVIILRNVLTQYKPAYSSYAKVLMNSSSFTSVEWAVWTPGNGRQQGAFKSYPEGQAFAFSKDEQQHLQMLAAWKAHADTALEHGQSNYDGTGSKAVLPPSYMIGKQGFRLFSELTLAPSSSLVIDCVVEIVDGFVDLGNRYTIMATDYTSNPDFPRLTDGVVPSSAQAILGIELWKSDFSDSEIEDFRRKLDERGRFLFIGDIKVQNRNGIMEGHIGDRNRSLQIRVLSEQDTRAKDLLQRKRTLLSVASDSSCRQKTPLAMTNPPIQGMSDKPHRLASSCQRDCGPESTRDVRLPQTLSYEEKASADPQDRTSAQVMPSKIYDELLEACMAFKSKLKATMRIQSATPMEISRIQAVLQETSMLLSKPEADTETVPRQQTPPPAYSEHTASRHADRCAQDDFVQNSENDTTKSSIHPDGYRGTEIRARETPNLVASTVYKPIPRGQGGRQVVSFSSLEGTYKDYRAFIDCFCEVVQKVYYDPCDNNTVLHVTDFSINEDLLENNRFDGYPPEKIILRIAFFDCPDFVKKIKSLNKGDRVRLNNIRIRKSDSYGLIEGHVGSNSIGFNCALLEQQDPQWQKLSEKSDLLERAREGVDNSIITVDSRRDSTSVDGGLVSCRLQSTPVDTFFDTYDDDQDRTYRLRGRVVETIPNNPEEYLKSYCTPCNRQLSVDEALCRNCDDGVLGKDIHRVWSFILKIEVEPKGCKIDKAAVDPDRVISVLVYEGYGETILFNGLDPLPDSVPEMKALMERIIKSPSPANGTNPVIDFCIFKNVEHNVFLLKDTALIRPGKGLPWQDSN